MYQLPEGERLLRHALAILRRQPHPDPLRLSQHLGALVTCLGQERQPSEAIPLLNESLALLRSSGQENTADYVDVLSTFARTKHMETEVAAMHNQPADLEGAIAAYRQVNALYSRFPSRRTDSLKMRLYICILLHRAQHVAEAEAEARILDADVREVLGEDTAMLRSIRSLEGILAFGRGDYQAAAALIGPQIDYTVANMPGRDRTVVQVRGTYGVALTRLGRAAEGEPFVRAAYTEGRETERFPFRYTFGNVESALGECLLAQQRYAETEPLLLTGHDELETRLGPQDPQTLRVGQLLHDLYLAWNKPTEATRYDFKATAQTVLAP